jgi:SAM-dependent methyltransferase
VSAPSSERAPLRYQDRRAGALHGRQPPWHPLGHVIRELQRGVERGVARLEVAPGQTVLDFGCATLPYRDLFPGDVTYLGADLPGNADATVEVRADGTLPLSEESVDAVISTQVLEHVDDPATYLAECARVLRPGGRLLLTTHGMMLYHPDPVDYWRWTCAGLERILVQAGLEPVHREGIVGLAASGLQFVQDSFYQRLPRRLRPLWALLFQTLARAADRIEPQVSRDYHALVFAVVAVKR